MGYLWCLQPDLHKIWREGGPKDLKNSQIVVTMTTVASLIWGTKIVPFWSKKAPFAKMVPLFSLSEGSLASVRRSVLGLPAMVMSNFQKKVLVCSVISAHIVLQGISESLIYSKTYLRRDIPMISAG